VNADLVQFVREALARGQSREQVRAALSAARWRAEEIDTALAAWADGEPGLPVPRRRISLSAREAFQHLLLFATLYLFTFDVGALLFVLIEWRIRDAALAYDPGMGALSMLRWSTSGVVTALPIFLWTHHHVERAMAREPEKRSSGVRRWLTYLTLFVAALVLIGNFSTVVANALSGELSLRFALKSLVVFAIAGLVFGHYLGALRREETENEVAPRASWLGRAGIAGAVLAAIVGLFSVGSPQHARVRQFDSRRVDDLVNIDAQVSAYYLARHALPPTLDSLVQGGFDVNAARDPVTGQAYEYQVVDSTTFTLAAVFATADTLRPSGARIERPWRHNAGRCAFTRHASGMAMVPPSRR
jgi:hypothetical protein